MNDLGGNPNFPGGSRLERPESSLAVNMKELFPSGFRATLSSRFKGSAWGKESFGRGAESEAPYLGGFCKSFLQESEGLLQSREQGKSEHWIFLLLVESGVVPDSAGSLSGRQRKYVPLEFKLYGRH